MTEVACDSDVLHFFINLTLDDTYHFSSGVYVDDKVWADPEEEPA